MSVIGTILGGVAESDVDKEEWRDVPTFEGYFQVSNFGRVRSMDRMINHRSGGKSFKRGVLLSPVVGNHGYYFVNLTVDRKQKVMCVHQLVAMAFLGHAPCRFKLVIDHIDGNKLNNLVSNLHLVSNRDNVSKCNRKKTKTSSFVGVRKYKNKWRADISSDGKRYFIGYCYEEDDAKVLYNKAKQHILNGGIIDRYSIKNYINVK